MRGSARRAGRPLPRLGRLVLSRNELRRPSDRIEAAIIMSLAAAFLTAVVAAACSLGTSTSPSAAPRPLRPTLPFTACPPEAIREWPGHPAGRGSPGPARGTGAPTRCSPA